MPNKHNILVVEDELELAKSTLAFLLEKKFSISLTDLMSIFTTIWKKLIFVGELQTLIVV